MQPKFLISILVDALSEAEVIRPEGLAKAREYLESIPPTATMDDYFRWRQQDGK